MAKDRERPGDVTPVGRVSRGARLGSVAVRHAVRTASNAAAAPFRDEERARAAADEMFLELADDLVSVLGGMRGAAMKLGQLLAVIDVGILNEDVRAQFAQRLEPLYSSAPRWNDASMMRQLAAELGERRERIVELDGPIAAASIGQVYRGLLDDGREVAIKVQYPRVAAMVRADLKNLRLLTRLLTKYLPADNAQALVEEVSKPVAAELEYEKELANLRHFALAFRGHPAIVVPAPIDELCTGRVLVTEFLPGEPLTSMLGAGQELKDRVGEAIYRFYCGEMYRTGRFCADPHPGNILVLEDGRIGFVDFGMCVELAPAEHALERAVFEAVLTGDLDRGHRLVVDSGFIGRPDVMGLDEFTAYLDEVVGWHVAPGPVHITPERARRAATSAFMPGGGFYRELSGQTLHEAHALGRRNELSTCALLGQLGATAPWSGIAREILHLGPPATEMGHRIAAWQAGRTPQ